MEIMVSCLPVFQPLIVFQGYVNIRHSINQNEVSNKLSWNCRKIHLNFCDNYCFGAPYCSKNFFLLKTFHAS